MEPYMLTVQNYQPINYKPSFRCKVANATNVNELSQTSKKLLQDIYKLIKSEKTSATSSQIMRSKRFADGSFVELQGSNKGLNLKYMRMNQRPAELDINLNGTIEYKNKLSTDLNELIEKYIPDIIEREQCRYI